MVDFEYDKKNCVNVLENGGLILYPTDTVWGLGCNALDEKAVEKIYKLKERPKEKSMIVLLAEARDIIQYVAVPHPDVVNIVENFTRPTTVIFDGALGFPDNISNPDGTIAIRIVEDPFCKAIIKRLKRPIISTSANISGQPTPAFFDEIAQPIVDGVDYVVKYRQEDKTRRQPSRLVKINDDGSLTIIRP